MLIKMLADRFGAGGALLAKGTQIDVDDALAYQWIGLGVAAPVGNVRRALERNGRSAVRRDADTNEYSDATGTLPLVSGGGKPRARIRTNGYIHTRKPWTEGALATIAATYTAHCAVVAEGPFDWVRLALHQGIAGSASGQTAAIAVTADLSTITRRRNPFVGGVQQSWPAAVTFNDAVVPSVPAFPPSASGATVAAGNIAAGTGANLAQTVENHYFTDWVARRSVDREDVVGALPALLYRTYHPNAGSYSYSTGTTIAGPWLTDAAVHLGRPWESLIQPIDGVSTPGNFTASTASQGWTGAGAVQFLMRYRGLAVHAPGDSLFGGHGSQGALDGKVMNTWGHIGCAKVSKPTRPVTFANWGSTGQTTDTTMTRTARIRALYSPDVIAFRPFSKNDAGASLDPSVGLQSIMAEIAKNTAANCVTVLVTDGPGQLAAGAEANRQAANTLVRAICNNGDAYLLDFDAVVKDPAVPTQMLAAYQADIWHLNDAGYNAVGTEFGNVLTQILIDQGLSS